MGRRSSTLVLPLVGEIRRKLQIGRAIIPRLPSEINM
jgi:hypothetical protein